jgi:hypothetical protein
VDADPECVACHGKRRFLVPASSASIAAASAAPTWATAATPFLRASLIDRYRPAVHLLAVEGGDGRVRFLVAAHLNEAEPLRLPGSAVRDHLGGAYSAMSREQPFQVTAVNAVT